MNKCIELNEDLEKTSISPLSNKTGYSLYSKETNIILVLYYQRMKIQEEKINFINVSILII